MRRPVALKPAFATAAATPVIPISPIPGCRGFDLDVRDVTSAQGYTDLAKPQVEPSRLTQLAGQLGDLQKQVGSLKGLMR